MGSMTLNPVTPLITGATITRTDTGGTTSTIVIDATTAQGALDFSRLVVVFENYSTTASFTVTLNAGDDYSGVGVGNAAAITVATAGTAGFIKAIGGKAFESARYQQDDETAIFTITTAATAYVTAYNLRY